jgi:carbon monoxide dehydrogenase subunit G
MYRLDGRVQIRAAPEEIIRWLTEPELMSRWMLGMSSIEASGNGIRVEVIHGGRAGWTFAGEIVEQTTNRLVRRYRLASGGDQYERTVTYEIGDGTVDVAVVTEIPGLDERAAKMGAKAEQKALERSIERLRTEIQGEGGGFFARFRASGGSAGPL